MVNQKKRRSGFERKILFSSNFSAVSALPEKTKRKFIKSGSSGMRDISSASKENLEYQKILAGKFKAILYEIATKFSCSQLIIRPHPGEGGANFWDEIVRNKKNVGFDKNLTLSRSISEATVILHSGCTAAIDGAIQGVPSIYYFPLELDPRLIEQGDVSTKVSYQCYTECEVINALAKLLRMPVLLPRAARITERFSNVMDGKCYLRVAKELTHNSSDGFKVRSFPAFYFILKNFFSLRHWKDFLRAYFPRLTPGGRWASQRMPETSIASLDQIIGEQLKFKASKIKVESICPGLFLLSNKEAS